MSRGRYRALNKDGTSNIDRSNITRSTGDLYHLILSMGKHHFALWVLGVYCGVNLLFALIYCLLGPGQIRGLESETGMTYFIDCFFFSVQTFSTIGYGNVSPLSMIANVVVSIEAFIGMMSVAVMSGLLFARFSKPTAKVHFSAQALVTQHLGQRCLVFRMANGRLNQIAEASVKVTLLRFTRTAEGQEMRIQEDLELLRDHSQIFAASWLVAHPINEKSPLFNASHLHLEEMHAEILVSVTGYDEVYSGSIYARNSYLYDELVYDRQFANFVSRRGDKLHVDIEKISELAP
jgi:inward rectifier potassium channel